MKWLALLLLPGMAFAGDYTYVSVSSGTYRDVYAVNLDTPTKAVRAMRFSTDMGVVADDMAMALSTAHKARELNADQQNLLMLLAAESGKKPRKKKK